jgi:hypothetical protein
MCSYLIYFGGLPNFDGKLDIKVSAVKIQTPPKV